LGAAGNNDFQFSLKSETGGRYIIQQSSDLLSWTSILIITNSTGIQILSDPGATTNSRSFFRAQKLN